MRAKVVNNTVVKWPYSLAELRKDQPHVSFIGNPDNTTLEAYGSFYVTPVAKPATSSSERAVKTVELIGGRPTEVWGVITKTPQEIATELADLRANKLREMDERLAREGAREAHLKGMPASDEAKARQRLDAIENASTLVELNAISVDADW